MVLVIAQEFKHGLPVDGGHSAEKLQHQLVFDVLLGANEDLMVAAAPLLDLDYINGVAQRTDFEKRHLYDAGAINTTASVRDNKLIKAPTEMMVLNLILDIVGNWMKEMKTGRSCSIIAAIRSKLVPKLKAKSTANIVSILKYVEAMADFNSGAAIVCDEISYTPHS